MLTRRMKNKVRAGEEEDCEIAQAEKSEFRKVFFCQETRTFARRRSYYYVFK